VSAAGLYTDAGISRGEGGRGLISLVVAMVVDTRVSEVQIEGRGAGTMASLTDDEKERRARAQEWRAFRQRFLYSQLQLSESLRCCRRTVVAVEAGAAIPRLSLQRRFKHLKMAEEKRGRAATAWTVA
jgi:hypothetical protein